MFDDKLAKGISFVGALVFVCAGMLSGHASAGAFTIYADDKAARAGAVAATSAPVAETWFLVSPRVLSLSSQAGLTVEAELSVANLGSSSVELQFGVLDVDLDQSQSGLIRTSPQVLWSQTQSGNRGVAAGYSLFSDSGSYVADDFFFSTPATISRISTMGFNNQGTLADQVLEIQWFVFPDSAGVPVGDPERNPEAAVFNFTALPGDPGVDLADDNIVLDLELATTDLLQLGAGSYWLVVVPVFDFEIESGARRWNWFEGRPAQAFSAQIFSPELFLIPDWLDIPTRIPQVPEFAGLAFSIEGSLADGADPACVDELPAWLSITTESTTVPAAETRQLDLLVDSSLLPVGSTEIVLCIANELEPLFPLFVPIRLDTFLDPLFADSFELQR